MAPLSENCIRQITLVVDIAKLAGSLPVEIRKAAIMGCGEMVNAGDFDSSIFVGSNPTSLINPLFKINCE